MEKFIFPLMFLHIIVYSLKLFLLFFFFELDLFCFIFNSRYQISLNFIHFGSSKKFHTHMLIFMHIFKELNIRIYLAFLAS